MICMPPVFPGHFIKNTFFLAGKFTLKCLYKMQIQVKMISPNHNVTIKNYRMITNALEISKKRPPAHLVFHLFYAAKIAILYIHHYKLLHMQPSTIHMYCKTKPNSVSISWGFLRSPHST